MRKMALFIWRDTQAARGPLIRCGAANGWGDLLPGRGEPGRAGWARGGETGTGEKRNMRWMGRGLAGSCAAETEKLEWEPGWYELDHALWSD